MFVTIKCQSCGKDTQMSLVEPDYEGPFKCWKCQGFAMVRIKDGDVISWQTLAEDEAQRIQAEQAVRRKAAGG